MDNVLFSLNGISLKLSAKFYATKGQGIVQWSRLKYKLNKQMAKKERERDRVKTPHLKNGLINFAMENMIYSLIETE